MIIIVFHLHTHHICVPHIRKSFFMTVLYVFFSNSCFASYGICFTPSVVILLKNPQLYKLEFIHNRHSQVYAPGLPALELMRGGVSTAKGSN